MQLSKPIKITQEQTNKVTTSSGEFYEYISWKQSKDVAVGVGVHKSRFPKEGFLLSKKVDEVIYLLSGKGSILCVVDGEEQMFDLEKRSAVFVPKKTPFAFLPDPEFEILSSTGPAWTPKQQEGLDYRRKESGRMILE